MKKVLILLVLILAVGAIGGDEDTILFDGIKYRVKSHVKPATQEDITAIVELMVELEDKVQATRNCINAQERFIMSLNKVSDSMMEVIERFEKSFNIKDKQIANLERRVKELEDEVAWLINGNMPISVGE